MTGYEYFEQVLKSKGLKPFDVSKGTNIRSGVFSDWKAGRYTPKADKMQKIADFLGVPVEPLLGVQTDVHTDTYYKDAMSAMIAQQMFEDDEIRSLFHIKRNIPADRFKTFYDMITAYYQREFPDDTYEYDQREFTDRHEDE